MSKPVISAAGSGYRFLWADEKIEAIISRLHQHKDGRVTAEVLLQLTEGANRHLAQRSLNLQSDRALKDLRLTLEALYDTGNWQTLIEQLAVRSIERFRQGEPAVDIMTDLDQAPASVSYLLHPLILANRPTMLFGQGGSGKTLVAALTLVVAFLPWADNPFGWQTNGKQNNVLVLDWENEAEDWRRLTGYLCRGLGLANVAFRHRRCVQPCAEDIDAIQRETQENNISLVIIDSVGEAAGGGEGNLSENQAALQLFRSLRSVANVSPLLVHHTSKAADNTKTPYGSVYFWNMCRSVWEVRGSQEPGSNRLDVGLFHRKANFSRLFSPLSLSFEFEPDGAITVHRGDLTEVTSFRELLSDKAKITAALREVGTMMTMLELVEASGVKQSTVNQTLYRLKRVNAVVNVGGKWGLQAI